MRDTNFAGAGTRKLKIRLFFCSIIVLLFSACANNHGVPIEKISEQIATPFNPDTVKSVVLILPFQGEFADASEAIRDGFMKGYTQAHAEKTIQIQTINSDNYSTNELAYQAAVALNPNLIVGPLTKTAVNQLELKAALPIPTLALNQADANIITPFNLYQFSLDPKADAINTAQKIEQAGYQQAIVIAPNNDWGQGIATSFGKMWLAQNLTIIDSLAYEPNTNMTEAVKNIAQNHTMDELKNTAIFIVVTPKNTEKLLPLIRSDFPNMPIYSLPIAFNGNNLTDLDQVQFQITPWLLDHQFSSTTEPEQQNIKPIEKKENLYAFGFDAFSLTQFYLTHNSFAGLSINGKTGYITINSNSVIERKLTWVSVENGQIDTHRSSNNEYF